MSNTTARKRTTVKTIVVFLGVLGVVTLYLIGMPFFVDSLREVFGRYEEPGMGDYVRLVASACMLSVGPAAWAALSAYDQYSREEAAASKIARKDAVADD